MLKLLNMNNEQSHKSIKRKVQIVVIAHDGIQDEILLFEFNNNIPNNYIGFQNVTGAVDPGEEYEAAAARELWEESGIKGEIQELDLRYEFVDRWEKNCQERTYLCYLNQRPKVTLSPEHLNYKWIPLKSLSLGDYTFPSNFTAAKAAMKFLKEGK